MFAQLYKTLSNSTYLFFHMRSKTLFDWVIEGFLWKHKNFELVKLSILLKKFSCLKTMIALMNDIKIIKKKQAIQDFNYKSRKFSNSWSTRPIEKKLWIYLLGSAVRNIIFYYFLLTLKHLIFFFQLSQTGLACCISPPPISPILPGNY